MIIQPDHDGVVVRRKAGGLGVIFVLGTPPAPELTLRACDEAVAQALAFAERQRAGAWFVNGGDELVLLGTCREQTVRSAGAGCLPT